MQNLRLHTRGIIVTLAYAILLGGCGGANAAWNQPVPAASPTSRAVATLVPTTTTASAQETPTTSPTQAPVSVPNISVTAVLLPEALLDKLPRDAQGRIVGGPVIPYLNYAPTMIAGKKCPRVTKWTWKVIQLDSPLRPYGQVDDPCVVQNATDDFVFTEFADPAANTPDTIKDVEKVYKTDPALLNGLAPTMRDGQWQAYLDGKIPYVECDKRLFKLLDISPRTPLIANNDGTVSGNAMELTVFRVAQNVEPYECLQRSYRDGSVMRRQRVTESQLKGKRQVLKVLMVWNAASQHWRATSVYGAEVDSFYAKAKELWEAAPFKP